MNKWIIAGFLLAAGIATAEQLEKPDANTLWLENGKEIELGKKPNFRHWFTLGGKKELEIKPLENGKGFSFFGKDANGRKTTTLVKVSPEYPWLVFRITGLDLLKGYRNWTVAMDLGMQTFQDTTPQKGIYVFDLYQNLPEKAAARKTSYLDFWVYNLRMDFEYIKLVKKPDYAVRAECADAEIKPGSKVKFRAELAKEAEDVSISMFSNGQPSPVKINGEIKIQLKPADKTQKVWTAEVEFKNIGLRKPCKRHKLFMKMDVLGGDLDEPVWVGLPFAVTPKAEK